MTAIETHDDVDDLAPGPSATYDLIICHDDRIVFHDHYASPVVRLRMLMHLLTASDVVANAVDTFRANEVSKLHQSLGSRWSTAPDSVVDAIAQLCRRWSVQIYVSTTRKTTAAPAVLYSVITEYGPERTVVEHFPTREARRASLVERAETFFDAPGHIPDRVLADDQHLAALVAAFLMPATIALTESVLDESRGAYRSTSCELPVR